MRRVLVVLVGMMSLLSCSENVAVARYQMTGEIVRLDPAHKTAMIRHEAIKDASGKVWMEAMTMEFPVKKAEDLERMKVGDHIIATVFQRPSDYEYWIEGVLVATATAK